jgi:hypothetical protein
MPSHSEELADHGRDLFSAFLDSGQLPLLRESVMLFGKAAAMTPAGHPDRAGHLLGLGGAMLKLAERTGDADLLEHPAHHDHGDECAEYFHRGLPSPPILKITDSRQVLTERG